MKVPSIAYQTNTDTSKKEETCTYRENRSRARTNLIKSILNQEVITCKMLLVDLRVEITEIIRAKGNKERKRILIKIFSTIINP